MKKLFFFLASLLVSASMFAVTELKPVAADLPNSGDGGASDTPFHFTYSGITLDWEGAYYATDFRVYAKKSITLSAEQNITKVEFDGRVNKGFKATVSAGEITLGEEYSSQTTLSPVLVIEKINAKSITVSVDQQIRASAIRVFLEGGEEPVEPQPEAYFIKHPWGTGADEAWAWKALEEKDGLWVIEDAWGGVGANINTVGEDEGAAWIPAADITGADQLAVGDKAKFSYDAENKVLAVEKLGDAPVEPQPEAVYSVAGTANLVGVAWDEKNEATEMALVDGLYTLVLEKVELKAADEVKFKVVVNHDWSEAYPAQDYVINIAEDGVYNVTITFNAETKEVVANAVKEGGEPVEPQPEAYFIKHPWGTGADEAWAWKALEEKDGLWVIEDAWGGVGANINTVGEDEGAAWIPAADITGADQLAVGDKAKFSYDAENKALAVEKLGDAPVEPQPEAVYSVAGTANLVGVAWDEKNEATEMALVDGLYTLVLEKVELKATEEVKFKVVVNHDWSEAYPAQDYVINIAEDGVYNVTITFNAETKEVVANAVKEGGEPIEPQEHVYSVAGYASLVGVNWDEKNEATEMELVEGLYTLLLDKLTLGAGQYEFKVVVDHNWSEAYPSENYVLNIAEPGVYTITITFNAETKEVAANAVKEGDAPQPEAVYVVAGMAAIVNGAAWDGSNEENKMELVDGVYTLVVKGKELTAGTYEFKIVKDGSAWIPDGMGNNSQLVIEEAGTYDITFTYKEGDEAGAATAVKVGEGPVEPEAEYFIKHPWGTGLGADWTWKALTKNDKGLFVIEDLWGGEGANINTVASDEGADWYPAEDIAGAADIQVGAKVRFIYDADAKTLAVDLLQEPVQPEAEYAILINGETQVELTLNAGQTEWTEYFVEGVELAEGDVVTFYDVKNDVEWVVAVVDGTENIENTENGILVKVAGKYSFYLKLIEGQDEVWVAADGDQPQPEKPITVTLTVPEDWTTVYLWAWNENVDIFAAWPGQELPIVDGKASYTFADEVTSVQVIFSNGTVQTVDGEAITESTCYELGEADALGHLALVVVDCDTETGLEEVVTGLDLNAPMYNVLGMRVDKYYQGIVIQNGKKFIRR